MLEGLGEEIRLTHVPEVTLAVDAVSKDDPIPLVQTAR
jgi:hypothetical protein